MQNTLWTLVNLLMKQVNEGLKREINLLERECRLLEELNEQRDKEKKEKEKRTKIYLAKVRKEISPLLSELVNQPPL